MNSSDAFPLAVSEHSNESMHAQIARELRARILTRDLAAGSTMPAVRSLARRERVSASCVAGAYEILENAGFVYRHGGGWLVAQAAHRRETAEPWSRRRPPSLVELDAARDVQHRLLPPARIDRPGLRLVARHEAAGFVSGDFYDVTTDRDGSVDLVVADVAGKGIGAGLQMAWVKGMIGSVSRDRNVEVTLGEINHRLLPVLGRREFVALSIVRFDPRSRELHIASAGLPDPYLISRDAPVRALEIPGDRLPLGVRRDVEYRALELTLEPGDRLLVLSDGIPEALDRQGEPLGYERLGQLLARSLEPSRRDDPEGWLDHFLNVIRNETAAEPSDDWTAVVLESRPSESGP